MARKSVPNYVKIHDALKDEVEKGIWKIGQRLPSERDLAERFTVSRMTARQAVTALVDEGILDRRVGSGTYVASRRVREKMRGTTSFTEIISSQGKVPSTEVLSYIRTAPNEVECEKLISPKRIPSSEWSGFVMRIMFQFVMKWQVFLSNWSNLLIKKKLRVTSLKL